MSSYSQSFRYYSLAFALLLLSSCAQAQRPSPSQPPSFERPTEIRGQLRLPGGSAAAEGILIVLENSNGMEISRVMTDSRGKFSFDNVGHGIFVVKVHQHGYHETVDRVDLSMSPQGFANLELIPVAEGSGNVPPGGPGAAISATDPASEEGRKELKLGQQELFEHGNPEASIPHFQKLLKKEPKYTLGDVLLGSAYMNLQRYKEAESAFREAVKNDPKNYAANFALGACLNQQKSYGEAEKVLLNSLALNANGVEGHYELSRTYLALNRWQDAEPHALKATQLQPDFGPAHVAMGNILLRKRDAPGALAEFQKYLELDPKGMFAEQARTMVSKIQAALGTSNQH